MVALRVLLIFLFLIGVCNAQTGVLLDTTFDFGPWSQTDGVLNITRQSSQLNFGGCGYSCGGLNDAINADGNYSGGGGGNGLHYVVCNGDNANGCGAMVDLGKEYKELWIRFYYRFPLGFQWTNNSARYDKMVYLWQGNSQAFASMGEEWQRMVSTNGTGRAYGNPETGFNWRNGGNTGDGKFHSIEFYVKRSADNTSGIWRCWVDDVLVGDVSGISWVTVEGDPLSGIRFLEIPSNQAAPENPIAAQYVDVDDLKVVTADYQNFVDDGHGNRRIGSLGGGDGGDKNPPSPPSGLTIK